MDATTFESLRAAASQTARGESSAAGWLAILALKQQNREVYLSLEAKRLQTVEAKAALEKTHLALQNLLYEKAYYEREIRSCREFRSAFSDAEIALADEAEFERLAPAELLQAPTDGDAPPEHARMLNRLRFELAERKQLGVLLAELKLRKKAMLQTITSRRQFVLSLSTELKRIQASAGALQKMISLPDLVPLLPPSLAALHKSFEEATGLSRRFLVGVFGVPSSVGDAPQALSKEADDAADDDEGRLSRKRDETAASASTLSVQLDLFAVDGLTRLLSLRFEQSAGGVQALVEQGDAAVLQHGALADALEAREEPPPADAPPRWVQQLAQSPDSAYAASVLTLLFEGLDARSKVGLLDE